MIARGTIWERLTERKFLLALITGAAMVANDLINQGHLSHETQQWLVTLALGWAGLEAGVDITQHIVGKPADQSAADKPEDKS